MVNNELHNKGNLAARGRLVDIDGLANQFLIVIAKGKITFAGIIARPSEILYIRFSRKANWLPGKRRQRRITITPKPIRRVKKLLNLID